MQGCISKIKQVDGRQVIHISDLDVRTGDEREIVFKSAADPHPDFIEAFRALEEHVRFILEWPSTYAKGRVRVTGVSISRSDDSGVEGGVITGLVELENADAPFNFNTPHLPFEQYSEGNAAKLMPEEAVEALNDLRREAAAFIDGKRAQGDLFDGKGKDAAKPEGKVPVANLAAVVAKAVDKVIEPDVGKKKPARTPAEAAADRAEARRDGKIGKPAPDPKHIKDVADRAEARSREAAR